ncbi:hypothetical protein RvY_17005 [Ramazzottius varieornatus]|uniref:Uncharacterized protein n=1 Tax=Ramazzottius varieornatus TaxID=947166 RepID=A0A1D1W7S6_RAMVA|nr:hypothetical protein RvY_17005 [Ramazzottius varieornatus]
MNLILCHKACVTLRCLQYLCPEKLATESTFEQQSRVEHYSPPHRHLDSPAVLLIDRGIFVCPSSYSVNKAKRKTISSWRRSKECINERFTTFNMHRGFSRMFDEGNGGDKP